MIVTECNERSRCSQLGQSKRATTDLGKWQSDHSRRLATGGRVGTGALLCRGSSPAPAGEGCQKGCFDIVRRLGSGNSMTAMWKLVDRGPVPAQGREQLFAPLWPPPTGLASAADTSATVGLHGSGRSESDELPRRGWRRPCSDRPVRRNGGAGLRCAATPSPQ